MEVKLTGGKYMNVYMLVDLEGISGIYDWEQMLPSRRRFAEARQYMTDDINVVVDALKEAGVDKVYVFDGHGGSMCVEWDRLTDQADYYICGRTGDTRMPGFEECDALILLGYHSMAGTTGGMLEHSMSSEHIQNYWINGQKGGEIMIDAAIAGDHGKPVIMVSGDDKTCAEASALLPWVVTDEVKKGVTWAGGMLLPRAKAHALLAEKAKEAVANYKNCKPYVLQKPVTMRVELMERCDPPWGVGKKFLTKIDARTYEVVADTMMEALYLTH